MNNRDLRGLPPTKGMLWTAIHAPPDSEDRNLVFPHTPGITFKCGYFTKILQGKLEGDMFSFVGIVLMEDSFESEDLIVGTFDLFKLTGQATTGHKVTEREELQKLTEFKLPKFD